MFGKVLVPLFVLISVQAQAALTEFDFDCSVYAAREANDQQLWARGYRDIFRLAIKDGQAYFARGDLHQSHQTVGEIIKWHPLAMRTPVAYVDAATRAQYPYMLSSSSSKADTMSRWTTGFKFQVNGSDMVGFLTSSNRSNSGDDQLYSGDLIFRNGLKLQDGAVVYNIRLGFCFAHK